jgi:hypothetical protein
MANVTEIGGLLTHSQTALVELAFALVLTALALFLIFLVLAILGFLYISFCNLFTSNIDDTLKPNPDASPSGDTPCSKSSRR